MSYENNSVLKNSAKNNSTKNNSTKNSHTKSNTTTKQSPPKSTTVLKDIQNSRIQNKLDKRACHPGAGIENNANSNAYNGFQTKKEAQSSSRNKVNCSPDAEVQLLLSTAVTIAAGRRSRSSSQTQNSVENQGYGQNGQVSGQNGQSHGQNGQNRSSTSESQQPKLPLDYDEYSPVNLNRYEYPQLDKILKSEPKCVHIKRIDRSQSVGNSFILHLQSPAIKESLKQDSSSILVENSSHNYFQDQYSLFCLDCCSQYKTVEELSYKVRNYHVCNNPASELYNSKCPGVLFLEKQTNGVFCAQCYRFLLQDNKQDDLRQIRDISSTQLGFLPSNNLKKLQQWATCYSRLNLVKRHFRAWKYAVKNKDKLSQSEENAENAENGGSSENGEIVGTEKNENEESAEIENGEDDEDETDHKSKKSKILTKSQKNNSTPDKTAAKFKVKINADFKNKQPPAKKITERITVYDPREISKREIPKLPEQHIEPENPEKVLNSLFKTYGRKRYEYEKAEQKAAAAQHNKSLETLSLKSPSKQDKTDASQRASHTLSNTTYLTKGLKNLSNTCYVNSVVQALSYLPKFINHFVKLNFGVQTPETTDSPNPLAIALGLQYLLKEIRKNDNDLTSQSSKNNNAKTQPKSTNKSTNSSPTISSNIYNPETFVTNCVKTFNHFDNTEQHDVHEFIVTLLDTLMNANDKRNFPIAQKYSKIEDHVSSDISRLFRAIFMGELQQLTTCLNCQTLSKTSVPLFPLTVSIEQTNVDLQEQVDSNFDDFPFHLLDDLHEVRKYNLRKRQSEPKMEPKNDKKSNRVTKSENDVKGNERGNKRGNKRVSTGSPIETSQEKRRKYGGGSSPGIGQTSRSANASPVVLPLESLLDDFFKQENLDVYCQKCFENMKEIYPSNNDQLPIHKVKRYQISRLPSVVIIHINRSKFQGGIGRAGGVIKDATRVDIHEELDFKNYCRKSQHFTKPGNTKYLLSAIIVHDGVSINSGHYRVYCMNQYSKKWLHFNDSRLQVCQSFEELKRSLDGQTGIGSPYLLFYSKASDYKDS